MTDMKVDMKRTIKIFFLIIVTGLILAGCAGGRDGEVYGQLNGLQENKAEQKRYGIILKSHGNPYNDLVEQGFKEVIESNGDICISGNPEIATAQEQISLIESMMAQKVDAIAVAANDKDALQMVLQEAMARGITVTTLDSDTNAESRQVFVNQADTKEIGAVLMGAVLELSGGEGQWAILSATNQAVNQNAWIEAMKDEMEEEPYKHLQLVDVVYGDDEMEASKEKTLELIRKYPHLKVICAPTVVGLTAAAEILTEMGLQDRIKLTGLGLPSHMAPYIGAGDEYVCPYLYLWDPVQVGRVSAYLSIAMVEEEIDGRIGDQFPAGELGSYQITQSDGGGAQVIVAPPLKIDPNNIEEWKNTF